MNFKRLVVVLSILVFLPLGFVCAQVQFPIPYSPVPPVGSDEGVGAFRGGNITTELVSAQSVDGGFGEVTIRFIVKQVWLTSSAYSFLGYPIQVLKNGVLKDIIGPVHVTGQGLDPIGRAYNIIRYEVVETFSGDDVARLGGCMFGLMEGYSRVSNLVNAPGRFFRVGTVFDINNSTESGKPSIPFVLELEAGQIHTVPLSIAHNDPASMIHCGDATRLTSGIVSRGPISVSNDCILTADLTNAQAGDEYAVQSVVRVWVPGSCPEHQGVDYIVRVKARNRTPRCSSTVTGSVSVPVGHQFNVTFTGVDDDSDPLELSLTGVPTGATVTPNNLGGVFNSPINSEVSWIPSSLDQGKSFDLLFTISDPRGQTATCGVSVEVPFDQPQNPCNPGEVLDICGVCNGDNSSCCVTTNQADLIASLDGNSLAQKNYARYLGYRVLKHARGNKLTKRDKKLINTSNDYFISAWTHINEVAPQTLQCTAIFGSCLTVDSSRSLAGYLDDAAKLRNLSLTLIKKSRRALKKNRPDLSLRDIRKRMTRFRKSVDKLYTFAKDNSTQVNVLSNQCSL